MSPHRPSSSVAPAPRAIILAAGQGTRLRPFTDDRPKCMVEVAGRPILHHQLRALRHHGINEIVIVRGYLGDRISPDVPDGVTFIDNPNYASHQILLSLFAAGTAFTGDCIVSYADIVYHPDAVATLLASPASATLIVDRQWQRAYEGRTDHPLSEAELCFTTRQTERLVRKVGKRTSEDEGSRKPLGEFIGLAKFTAPYVARMWARYDRALARGRDQPVGRATSLDRAYLTDLLNVGLAEHDPIIAATIDGRWREIDTVQDLERAHAVVNW